MNKPRWRDLAKTFGSHVDPDKTEQLTRSKSDVENNVTRIFKLIKSDDPEKKDENEKDGNSKGSRNEMELVELIENFYQQYQSLYALYDHLIEESRKIVRRRRVRSGSSALSPTSSIASGSDSDEFLSADELEVRNAKPENQEQHRRTDSNHDIKTLSGSSSEEKLAINTEYLAALKKAHADITSEDLNNGADERVKELSALVEAHEHHGSRSLARVKELERQLAGFKTDLESLCSEKRALEAWKQGKVAAAEELGEEVTYHPQILELELVLKDKINEICDLTKKLEDEKSSTSKLTNEIESLQAQKAEMEERMATMKDESSAQAKGLTDKIEAMKTELDTLRQQRAKTGMQLDKKEKEINQERREVDTLKEELKRKDVSEKQLSEERQRYVKQVKDMELQVDSLRSHKKNLEKQRRSKMHETDKLRRESDGLRAKIAELEKTLAERGEEVSALCKACEDGKNEASTQVMSLMTQVGALKIELDSLKHQKSQIESQREKESNDWLKRLTEVENETEKKLLEERQKFLDQLWDKEKEVNSLNSRKTDLEKQVASKVHDTELLRHENGGLSSKVLELEKTLTERGDEMEILSRECEDGKSKADEAANKLMALTKEVSDLKQEKDTLQAKIRQLEMQIEKEKKERESNEMETKIGDLKRVIKEQEDTIKKTTKDYQNAKMWFPESKLNLQLAERKMEELAKKHRLHFEDNVRLLYQRVRVAEQIHNDMKDGYRRIKEDYERETRELREQLAFYENPLKKTKGLSLTAKRTLSRLDRVTSTFDEEHSNIMSSIDRMSDEVQLAKCWVTSATSEIKRLKHESESLAAQESLLREKVWKLEATASKEAGEKLNLMTNFRQLEKQVVKMEKTIKEKDDDLLSLGEEKREVIRQLCMLVDHHRVRYRDLKEVISKSSGRPLLQ